MSTKRDPRLTMETMRVLRAFFERPREELAGRDIGRGAKVASGTLYPILLRLEDAGWLESRWEAVSPQEAGRPRRRYYKMTNLGFQKTQDALRELSPMLGVPAWD